jgi:hypothetical protein
MTVDVSGTCQYLFIIQDIPRHVHASFFGVPDYDQDKWMQSEKMSANANTFYGDGTRLAEVYGNKGESID